MDAAIAAAIATVLATAITGLTSRATARASAKGAAQAATVTSMAEIEKEAGERAKKTYNELLDLHETKARSDAATIAELRAEIADLHRKDRRSTRQIEKLQQEVSACIAKCRRLERLDGPDSPIGP